MRVEKEIRVNIAGKDRTIVSDDDYLKHIKRGFEPEMVALYRSLLKRGDVVLDVGANIGCTAIVFSELAQMVHAFEPSRTTCNFLRRNIAGAGLTNVAIHDVGLGAVSGEFPLTFNPSNRSGGFVSNQLRAGAGHVIETISLRTADEMVKALNIPKVDFIKIDVEGFERDVLMGAKGLIAAHRPVVVLELNHWCLNAFQRISIPDFFDLLRSLFPVVLAVDGESFMNLHDESESYTVMYQHILHMKFPNVVAAFDAAALDRFYAAYQHGAPRSGVRAKLKKWMVRFSNTWVGR